MASLLIVTNPKTGEEVAVSAAHFRKALEPEGWKAVCFEDGSLYEPPAKHAEKAADKPKDGETAKG